METGLFPQWRSGEREILPIEPPERQAGKLRIAAYARVSTDMADQLNSLATQVSHYQSLLTQHPEWELADIYADEGLTGTRMDIREEFQRMLGDCRRGRIDRILCKSVSRFCRNTGESLQILRELRMLGVSVYFEKEKIDTAKLKGEFLLALHACFAQEESQSISGNIRRGNRMRMKNGTYTAPSVPYGYRLEGTRLTVQPEEAETVRFVFSAYLSGSNMGEIAEELNRRGIPVRNGNHSWQLSAIAYQLSNERYIGDCLWQKTYTTAELPHRQLRNKGELERYYVRERHPAIISREDFQTVQRLRKWRTAHFRNSLPEGNPLERRVRCAQCGSSCRRKTAGGVTYRVCREHLESVERCPVTQLPEKEIPEAFIRMVYKLHSHPEILEEMEKQLERLREGCSRSSGEILELNQQIAKISEQNRVLADLQSKGVIDSALSISQQAVLAGQISALRKQKRRLLEESGPDETLKATQRLRARISALAEPPGGFDPALFDDLVETVLIERGNRIRFRLKNGLELPETVQRRERL